MIVRGLQILGTREATCARTKLDEPRLVMRKSRLSRPTEPAAPARGPSWLSKPPASALFCLAKLLRQHRLTGLLQMSDDYRCNLFSCLLTGFATVYQKIRHFRDPLREGAGLHQSKFDVQGRMAPLLCTFCVDGKSQ